jgi:hypothetical protein
MLLFKYKLWGERTKDIIQNSRIYFPIKAQLNDPSELIHPIEFANNIWDESFEIARKQINKGIFLSSDKISQRFRYLEAISRMYPEVLNDTLYVKYKEIPDKFLRVVEATYDTYKDVHEALKYYALVHAEDLISQYYSKEGIVNRINLKLEQTGILSLASKNNCPLMWAHYSNSHKGIVLVFDIEKDKVFSKARMVEYVINRPLISIENISNILYQKSNLWSYENEYRIISKKGQISYSFAKKALVGVIMGMHMGEKDTHDLIDTCYRYRPDINLYKAEASAINYSINCKEFSL